MNILPISCSYNFKTNNVNKSNENRQGKQLDLAYNSTNPLTFNPAYLVSFGGYCTDLSKAIKTLKATEIFKEDKRIPQRVETLASGIIKKGNPQQLTLIDVHKQAYFNIMYAKSISEVREMYPEFRSVLAVQELDPPPQQGSFLREILDGKNEYFDKDSDISLQLMKLYWGEGFSLSDLEKHMNIKSSVFASVMRILNIPTKNKHYASVLKHSDPEVSKRIAEMTAATKSANFEKTNGYISIPKGQLPYEMKEKILDSLFAYYEKDPMRVYEQPKIVKGFYDDNVLAKEIYRATLFEVWNFGSMKSIKRGVVEFFNRKMPVQSRGKGAREYTINDLYGYNQLSREEIECMQEYFRQNVKDKEIFSRSLRSAYKHVKARLESEKKHKSEIVLYPKKLQEIILEHYRKTGRDTSEFIPNLLKVDDSKRYQVPISGRVSIQSVLEKDIEADISYTKSLLDTFNFAYSHLFFDNSKAAKEVKGVLENIFSIHKVYGLGSNSAMNYYLHICSVLLKAKKEDAAIAISRYLEKEAVFDAIM